MNPVLLFPVGLAALAALALPLLVHLARREENRPLDFAALRWLDQRPRPRSRIRFDERWLLALRLLLLALIALWLARPALTGQTGTADVTLVVPGADLAGVGGTARWLAPGFPPVDTAPPLGPVPVMSLLRQADAELPPGGRLRVLTPSVIEGADAERPRLSRAVRWQVVGGRMAAARPTPTPPLRLAIRTSPGQPNAVPVAVARAWGGPMDVAAAGAPLPPTGTLLAWQQPGPIPAAVTGWVKAGGTALLSSAVTPPDPDATTLWRSDDGTPLLTLAPLGRGRVLHLARPLTLAAMPMVAEADFPRRLGDIVAPPPVPARVVARDHAPLTGASAYPQPARSLQPWLGAVIAALFLLERLAATRARRAPAP